MILESTLLAAVTAKPAIADEDLAGGISPTGTRPVPERGAIAAAGP
jgi:hypothetical protein